MFLRQLETVFAAAAAAAAPIHHHLTLAKTRRWFGLVRFLEYFLQTLFSLLYFIFWCGFVNSFEIITWPATRAQCLALFFQQLISHTPGQRQRHRNCRDHKDQKWEIP